MSAEVTTGMCRFFPADYDTARYCSEHGGFAWMYGPHQHRCDRAPAPATMGKLLDSHPGSDDGTSVGGQ